MSGDLNSLYESPAVCVRARVDGGVETEEVPEREEAEYAAGLSRLSERGY